jgi:hypothetical protein
MATATRPRRFASGAAIDHLEVEGEMPSGFDQIRDHLLSQQKSEDGSEAEVDYVFDIPLDTARLVSGFSWSETEPADGFVVLRLGRQMR